ncbi:MAG: ABC transporter substrate-binding protein [Nocardiopsaceae bacterium]|nr:ABC transporter substrate-binding protein [Nocardiopsaceae bacterium]
MRAAWLGMAVAMAVAVAACGGASGGGSSPGGRIKAAPVKKGGSITVLEVSGYSGSWPSGLDPVTNLSAVADQDQMDAIYGSLFELGPKGKIIPDLASGYSFSPDAKTVTIRLRHGVTFTDGTPFNAQAVLWDWNRLFTQGAKTGTEPAWDVARTNPKNPLSPPVKGAIQAKGPYTIVIHQDQPNGAFIDQMIDLFPDWIGSPAAFRKMGEDKFAKDPVGAGPFQVVSDTTSSQLVVKKNPGYWQKGHPYLNQITFKTVGSDESALESMQAGQGQVYEDLGTYQLIGQAEQHFQVLDQPGTSPYDLQLNTAIPPFNNPKARQAIYAATNFAPILKAVFGDRYPATQSFTGDGGLCYEPKVPGYQGYNLPLAKKLAKESGLDKTTVNLGTISSYSTAVNTTEALRTEWAKAGIHASIQSYSLTSLDQAFEKDGGKWWQSMVQTAGSWDPAASVGVDFRFLSTSPISGVHDPHLDTLLNQAQGYVNTATRCKYYREAAAYIAKKFYGPFYFTVNPTNVSAKGIGGPGLTTPLPAIAVTPAIPWEDVWYNPSAS